MDFILVALAAFVCSSFVAYILFKLSPTLRVFDPPNHRTIQSQGVPTLGGIAIFSGFVFPCLVFYTHFSTHNDSDIIFLNGFFLAALFLIFLLGIIDDLKGMNAPKKFFIQTIAAVCVYTGGIRIEMLSFPFLEPISLGPFGLPITLIWIVGLCNAMNLIDGLDGLAAGVSAIGALTLFVVSLIWGNVLVAFLAIILVGSILGFLRFNSFPARLFMGDSGSLVIGFILAVLSLQVFQKSTNAIPILIPMIALGLPIADTLVSIVRRYVKGRSLFSADKEHFHHKLLSLGFSHSQSVILLYGLSAILSAASISMAIYGPSISLFVLPFLGVLFLGVLSILGYIDLDRIRSLLSTRTVDIRTPSKKVS